MKNIQNFADNYMIRLSNSLNQIPVENLDKISGILLDAHSKNKNIFIFGNGGSASTSSHFANDLNKLCNVENKKRFKTIALTDSVPLMTAWANDDCYESIFVEQLKNLMGKEDVCIAISCSGNSNNVIRAIEYAKKIGGKTIALLGFEGGKLKGIVDECIIVKSEMYGVIEDTHHAICHVLANYLRGAIKES